MEQINHMISSVDSIVNQKESISHCVELNHK